MLNYMTARRSINFISFRRRRRISFRFEDDGNDATSYQHSNGQTSCNNQPKRNKSDPINFELTKQLTQLTLLTNDDDDTDGTSNMVVMFRVSLECVEFS